MYLRCHLVPSQPPFYFLGVQDVGVLKALVEGLDRGGRGMGEGLLLEVPFHGNPHKTECSHGSHAIKPVLDPWALSDGEMELCFL